MKISLSKYIVTEEEWDNLLDEVSQEHEIRLSESSGGPNTVEYIMERASVDYENRIYEEMETTLNSKYGENQWKY